MRTAAYLAVCALLVGVWGCPSSPRKRDLGFDAPPETGVLDGPVVEVATPPLDGPGVLSVSFDPVASTNLPIGRHVMLRMMRSPSAEAGSIPLTAAPCLLKLKGKPLPQSQGKSLLVDLPAGTASADLVVFAPPDARPESSCQLTTPDAKVQVQALSFTVKPPSYQVLSLGDHSVSAIHGMKVTTLGQLTGAYKELQALTYAAGSFQGAWFAVFGDNGDHPTPAPMKSTVKLYRFTPQDSGDIAPWLDLTSQAKSPTAVEDMVWSPLGPCPLSQDALYLGAAGMDDPGTGNDGEAGGIYCFDATKQMATIYDNKARALDVDRAGSFLQNGAKGTLFVTRWGGYFAYPGGAELTDPAFPGVDETPGHSGSELRFAHGGAHAGHLYALDEWAPQPLVRITPEPHTAAHIADFSPTSSSADFGTPALVHGGAFGDLLVVPRHDPNNYREYELVAYFEEPGQVRQLVLIKSLHCGQKVAFDDKGIQLAVVTAASQCGGTKTAHLFEFDLP